MKKFIIEFRLYGEKRHNRYETVEAENLDKAQAILCTKYKYPIDFINHSQIFE